MADGALHHAWVCWDEKTSSLPQLNSKASGTSEWWGGKKWWHQPGLFNAVPYNQEHPQGYCMEQFSSSADVLPLCLRRVICWILPCWMWQRNILWLSHPYRNGLITGEEIRTQGRRANQPTCLQWTASFRACGSCPFRRIGPCAEETATSTSGFTGSWVDESSPSPLEEAG